MGKYFEANGKTKAGDMLSGAGDWLGEDENMDKVMGAAGDVIGGAATFGAQISKANTGKGDRSSRRGNLTHEVNTGADVAQGAMAGAKIGSNFGPWGTLIGAGGGALISGVTSMVDQNNQPTAEDLADRKEMFDLESQMDTIQPEKTFAVQQQVAENGMDIKGNTKQIEVEKDEIVLRKVGKGFKKVADFKGGKPHEMGGEQYTAQEGDIIFPGKDRRRISNLVKNRRWTAIESARQKLPTDTPDGTAEFGTNVLQSPMDKEKFAEINDMYPDGTSGILADPGKKKPHNIADINASGGIGIAQLADDQSGIDVANRLFKKKYEPNSDNLYTGKYGSAYGDAEGFEQKGAGLFKSEGDYIMPAESSRGYNDDDTRNYLRKIRNLPENMGRKIYYKDASGNEPYKDYRSPMYEKGTSGVKMYKEGTSGVETLTAQQAQEFIDKHADGEAPVTGEQLYKIAQEMGIPLKLLLIQGAQESGFGTKGAGKRTKNIYNVGNVTAGDELSPEEADAAGYRKDMGDWEKGIRAYGQLLLDNYAPEDGNWDSLLEDGGFVNKAGNRYATDANYEANLRKLGDTLPGTVTPPTKKEGFTAEEKAKGKKQGDDIQRLIDKETIKKLDDKSWWGLDDFKAYDKAQNRLEGNRELTQQEAAARNKAYIGKTIKKFGSNAKQGAQAILSIVTNAGNVPGAVGEIVADNAAAQAKKAGWDQEFEENFVKEPTTGKYEPKVESIDSIGASREKAESIAGPDAITEFSPDAPTGELAFTEAGVKKPTPKADMKARIGGPVSGDTALDIINKGFGTLAQYAPAVYNIVKGTEKPDKINRNYLKPVLEKYTNRSQAQVNAIDEAFNAAISQSRNLSGGSMANFRSNVEQAHAAKLGRLAQVNTQEAGRADQIAAGNIGRVNQAQAANVAMENKADELDMRSEAATDAFLGQGMADIANISAVQSKDRQLEENQNMILDMIKANRPFNT